MKIIDKTVKKAYKNWFPCKEIRTYHYAAAFDGNKMIEFSQNNPIKTNTKAYRIGEMFNIDAYRIYSYPHAESALVLQLLNKHKFINPNWKIVVLRINREGRILLSKPCKNCQKIFDKTNLTKVYWSISKDMFAIKNHIIDIPRKYVYKNNCLPMR
jgi:hypothetical protein